MALQIHITGSVGDGKSSIAALIALALVEVGIEFELFDGMADTFDATTMLANETTLQDSLAALAQRTVPIKIVTCNVHRGVPSNGAVVQRVLPVG